MSGGASFKWKKFVLGGAFLVALVAGGFAGLQLYVDARLAGALKKIAEGVHREWGQVTATEIPIAPHLVRGSQVGRLTAKTGLLRKTCSGQWTIGLGARVQVEELLAPITLVDRESVTLRARLGCFDVKLLKPLSSPMVEIAQGPPLHVEGACGPTLSGGKLTWVPGTQLDGSLSITDRSGCLKALSFVAPAYPDALIPEQFQVDFASELVDMKQRPLPGNSPVSLVAELARRLRGANVFLRLAFKTTAGKQVATCFRMNTERTRTTFEIELGLSPESLASLSEPFLGHDNQRVLKNLRSDQATCDGSLRGLRFTSDLNEVYHRGKRLNRLPAVEPGGSGLLATTCDGEDGKSCAYDWGVIGFNEDGQLQDPRFAQTVLDSVRGSDKEGVLLVSFVHGWRHSGHPKDWNLFQFRALVRRLAELEKLRKEPRRVIALYLAWPGRLYESPSANKLATFWDRLEVAQQLGSEAGQLGAFLDDLTSTVQGGENESSFMVTLAYSMGAEALLSVLAAREGRPLGDQVILINPAASVERYQAVAHETMMTPLAIYGSVTDQVNQQLYPLGEALTFEGKNRDQLADHTTTLTNRADFITHRLDLRNGHPGMCAHESGVPLDAPCRGVPLSAQRLPHRFVAAVSGEIIPGHAEFVSPPMMEHLLELIAGR